MRTPSSILVGVLSLTILGAVAKAQIQDQFKVAQPDRLVAFGDIHGDYDALKTLLTRMRIIDEKENWIAGHTVLVSMGDLLDRGQNTRAVMDLLMKLERQAPATGGRVVALLGNHELMVVKGDYRYVSRQDAQSYRDLANENDTLTNVMRKAFSIHSRYGQWLLSRPALFQAGDTLFVHGGVEDWFASHSIASINSNVRQWFLYFMRAGPRPRNPWVINGRGPLWSRRLADEKVAPSVFKNWLKLRKIARVVVGHTITPTLRPVFQTMYGQQLIMIDTGISHVYDGNISAIEWTRLNGFKSFVFPRRDGAINVLPCPYLLY